MYEWLPLLASATGVALVLAWASEALFSGPGSAHVFSERALWLAAGVLLCCGVLAKAVSPGVRMLAGLAGVTCAVGPFVWRREAVPLADGAKQVEERVAQWRMAHSLPLLGMFLVAPALWFPSLRPELTVMALGLYVFLPVAATALGLSLWPRSEMDGVIFLTVLAAIVGAIASDQPELTVPKVSSFLLGVGLYYGLLQLPRDNGSRASLVLSICLAGLFVAVGLANGPSTRKVRALATAWQYVPRLIAQLPGTLNGLVSMNQLGGSLLWVAPILMAWCLVRPDAIERHLHLSRFLALLGALILAAVVVLTQSRAAWGGLLVGVAVVLVLSNGWGRWVVGSCVVALMLLWVFWGRQHLGSEIVQVLLGSKGLDTTVGSLALLGRMEIRQVVVECVVVRPWTGCGWGTLRGTPCTHAHNALLQIAYDMGIPGLVAYLATVVVACRRCVRSLRVPNSPQRHLAVGGLGALAAYHVYGVFDVVAVGSKPGVLWWCLLALIMTIPQAQEGLGVRRQVA